MILFYFVLILVCLSGVTEALSCVGGGEIFIRNFTIEGAKEIVKNQKLVDGYAKCAVDINFDYDQKYINIKFGSNVGSKNIKINQQVRVDTFMVIDDGKTTLNPARIETAVESACDYADGCDLQFIRDHLDWLFKVNHDQLMSVLRSLLLTHENKTGRNHLFISLLENAK
jgi:hypothetical protein